MSLVKKRNVETVWGYFIKSAKVWNIKEETITGNVMSHYFKKQFHYLFLKGMTTSPHYYIFHMYAEWLAPELEWPNIFQQFIFKFVKYINT